MELIQEELPIVQMPQKYHNSNLTIYKPPFKWYNKYEVKNMNKFEIKVIEGTTYRDFDSFDGYSYSWSFEPDYGYRSYNEGELSIIFYD